jgi:hypothetical protein
LKSQDASTAFSSELPKGFRLNDDAEGSALDATTTQNFAAGLPPACRLNFREFSLAIRASRLLGKFLLSKFLFEQLPFIAASSHMEPAAVILPSVAWVLAPCPPGRWIWLFASLANVVSQIE